MFRLEHRLQPSEPTSLEAPRWEDEATDLLLGDAPVSLARATALLMDGMKTMDLKVQRDLPGNAQRAFRLD